ncbi:MAG: TonB family protein [Chloroherpetonaceae bacterium]|nr:TonB family protein [Chloroherpetonaceae bacterium]
MKNLILFLLFLGFEVTKAQEGKGRILGQLVDESESPVPAATIFISNEEHNYASITNSQGYFVFLSIPLGNYTLKALKRGMSNFIPKKISLNAAQTLRLDLALGDKSETVMLAELTQAKSKETSKPAAQKKPVQSEVKLASTAQSKKESSSVASEKEKKPVENSEPLEVAAAKVQELKRIEAEAEALENSISETVEKEAEIIGGIEAVMAKINYPETAINFKIQGKVVVKLNLDSKGMISSVTLLKTAHPLLNEEAVRVLTEEAKFSPAEQGGKPVASSIVVPLNFSIKKVTW